MKSNKLPKEYTPEEIESIKINLRKATGESHILVDLHVGSIYNHRGKLIEPKVGDSFAYYYPFEKPNDCGMVKGWNKFTITYKRLDVLFVKVNKKRKETWIVLNSMIMNKCIPLSIDLSVIGIPDANIPLLKFDKGKCPYSILVTKNDSSIFKI